MKQLRSSADYGYRTNDDDSIDLICLSCGALLVNSLDSEALRRTEEEHLCTAKREKQKSNSGHHHPLIM